MPRAGKGRLLKAFSETCRDKNVSRIQQNGAQLARELRILQGALEVMRHEQARSKFSSQARNYSLPLARGVTWKQFAHKSAVAVSKWTKTILNARDSKRRAAAASMRFFPGTEKRLR